MVELSGTVHKRLVQVQRDIARTREALRIHDEQLAYLTDVAEEARTRAIVSSTPLADRQRHRADEDVRRLRRERDEAAARLHELRAEQDALLDRLAARVEGG